MKGNQHWHDPVAESYAATISHKVPGYHLLHELSVDVLETEIKGAASRILTVGAGGGEEIINMLQRKEDWLITGVDPSASMLDMAKQRVSKLHMETRVTWYETALNKVSAEAVYDAAVSLLVIHFVENRLPFLQEIAQRLQPGGPVCTSIYTRRDEFQRISARASYAVSFHEAARSRKRSVFVLS
ncbi:class I SAM-dependent methyltransferase [Bacillus safensis]|uniref:class I SAM-dependent methyltransferase n=1 Tax=Bacillus safensis TaxID=561879 RepID=UPI0038369F71